MPRVNMQMSPLTNHWSILSTRIKCYIQKELKAFHAPPSLHSRCHFNLCDTKRVFSLHPGGSSNLFEAGVACAPETRHPTDARKYFASLRVHLYKSEATAHAQIIPNGWMDGNVSSEKFLGATFLQRGCWILHFLWFSLSHNNELERRHEA